MFIVKKAPFTKPTAVNTYLYVLCGITHDQLLGFDRAQ